MVLVSVYYIHKITILSNNQYYQVKVWLNKNQIRITYTNLGISKVSVLEITWQAYSIRYDQSYFKKSLVIHELFLGFYQCPVSTFVLLLTEFPLFTQHKTNNVSISLQLVAASTIFIASKLVDPCPITACDLIKYTDNTYQVTELLVSKNCQSYS